MRGESMPSFLLSAERGRKHRSDATPKSLSEKGRFTGQAA
jgi:hypothetical protein